MTVVSETAEVVDLARRRPAKHPETWSIPACRLFFFRALELAPMERGGFDRGDVKQVERWWEIIDGMSAAFGYVVALHTGRRVYLQYVRDEIAVRHNEPGAKIQEELQILPMEPNWWYPPLSGGGVQWAEDADHINHYLGQ